MHRELKPPKPWFQVRFANLQRDARCIEGETVFQSARRAGIRVVGACGGRGVCGSCIVRVVSGNMESLPPAAGSAAARQSKKGWVRSCLIRPQGDCEVEVAPRSVAPVVRAEVDGQGTASIPPHPAVRSFEARIAPATLAHGGADADRILDALRESGARRIDFFAVRELPGLLREADWRVHAMVRGDEVIGIAPAGRRSLGLAVDLGTTNAAGFLMDLETGTRLASLGIENPQAPYGADVVSRITIAMQSQSELSELQAAAVAAINALAQDLCAAVSASTAEIVDIAICGNTAMHHLLLGLPVRQLGRAPFVPAMCEAMDIKARDMGVVSAAGAYVHLMPNVGGYVGGDHVAALLATEEQWAPTTTIVMDIGTNTEISLIHRGEITSVSSPSGPALEGGHISSGMRAAEGAIERVRIVDDRIELQVIGGEEPVGLCGSGVLDAVAAMLKAGWVQPSGRIVSGHPAVRIDADHREVALAPDVTLSQADVRAVQLAKAAIRAGVDMLLREAGIEENAIERVVIAGAFGAYIGIESAITIGLLPRLPLERYIQVGNAAGVGVRMALASTVHREQARRLAARCRYIELGSRPGFQKVFIGRISLE